MGKIRESFTAQPASHALPSIMACLWNKRAAEDDLDAGQKIVCQVLLSLWFCVFLIFRLDVYFITQVIFWDIHVHICNTFRKCKVFHHHSLNLMHICYNVSRCIRLIIWIDFAKCDKFSFVALNKIRIFKMQVHHYDLHK